LGALAGDGIVAGAGEVAICAQVLLESRILWPLLFGLKTGRIHAVVQAFSWPFSNAAVFSVIDVLGREIRDQSLASDELLSWHVQQGISEVSFVQELRD